MGLLRGNIHESLLPMLTICYFDLHLLSFFLLHTVYDKTYSVSECHFGMTFMIFTSIYTRFMFRKITFIYKIPVENIRLIAVGKRTMVNDGPGKEETKERSVC